MKKQCFLLLFLVLTLFFSKQALGEDPLVDNFQKTCESGIPEACVALGALYVYGQGVEQDYQKAAEFYQKACDLDGSIGCNILASNYRDGTEGMSQDYEKAISLFQKSCDLGEPSACEDLAEMFEKDLGQAKNAKTKTATLQKACDLGSTASCQKLPSSYSKGSSLEKECQKGNENSCFHIGIMYKQGKDVSKNEKKATSFLQKACDKKHNMGCYELGIMYQYGQGTPKDFQKAASAYQKACDFNEVFGCNKAGFLNYQKLNNTKQALKYFQKGCEQQDRFACVNLQSVKQNKSLEKNNHEKCDAGDANTCYSLGFLYFHGEDISPSSYYPYLVEKDYSMALSLFEKGCSGGEAESCRILGIMHAKGHGISPNRSKANEYYQKACDMGATHACGMIK